MAEVTLRGETHLERDEGRELSRLLAGLFRVRERPLRVAPADGPGMSSMTYLCSSEVLGRTVTGLLTVGPGGLGGVVDVADVLVGTTGMTGTTKSGFGILTPEKVGGVWLVVALSCWGSPMMWLLIKGGS